MNEALVREIASQIVRDEILANWLYWALLLAVLAVASFLGNWFGAYAAKRGELQATDAKFNDILAQIRQSTRATEEIRSAISLGEWSKKEQTTLRRMKLEELLLSALMVRESLDHEQDRVMFASGEKQRPEVMSKVLAIGGLYFPELEDPLAALDERHRAMRLWLLQLSSDLLDARTNNVKDGPAAAAAAENRVRDGAVEQFDSVWKPFAQALADFQGAAHDLMEKIVAVD